MHWPNNRLLFTALLLSLCSSLQNGFISSVLNIPQFMVEEFVNKSQHYTTGQYLAYQEETWLWSAIVTQRQIGQFLGTVICPLMTQCFGRKRTILLNTIPLVFGAFLQLISKYSQVWELLLIGRCLWGIGCGVVAVTIPVFISEISPNENRGAMASLHGMMIGLGSLLADLVSLPELLGTPDHWSLVYLVIMTFQFIQLIAFPFCPESPKELYIKKRDYLRSIESISFYQSSSEEHIRQTLDEYEHEWKQSEGSVQPVRSLLTSPELRMSILVGIGATCSYAFGGMQIVTNYTTEIFVNMDVSARSAGKASLAVGALRFLAVFPSVWIVEKFGRRKLLLASLWGCITCYTLLMLAQLGHDHYKIAGIGYLAVAITLTYGFMFSVGCQTVGTFLPSEVTPTHERAANQSLAVMLRFIFAFITTLSFLPLQRTIGGLCWLELIIPLLLTALFMHRCMPETKDRPIADILFELNTVRSLFKPREMQLLINEPELDNTELGYVNKSNSVNGNTPLYGGTLAEDDDMN